MSRQARLLFGLLGLWGGAFAWSQSTRPEQRRVARLTYTGEARAVPSQSAFSWPEAVAIRAEDRVVRRDLFASRVAAAPATPSATIARVPPAAPPLRYVGFVADGGGRRVFLAGTAGVLTVAEGDVLPGGWRVERIEAERVSLRSVVEDVQVDIRRDP